MARPRKCTDYTYATLEMLGVVQSMPDEWRKFSEHLWVAKDGRVFDCTILRGKAIPLTDVMRGYPGGMPRKNGTRKLVTHHLRVRYSIDWLVAQCWVPRPDNASTKIIIHKDGNELNNHADNLEWHIPERPYNPAPRKVIKRFERIPEGFVEVSPTLFARIDGKLMTTTGKNKMRIQSGFFYKGSPHILHHGKHIRVRDVVARAFLDVPDFEDVYILHKDEDMCNCALDNLEYVDFKPYQRSVPAQLTFE